MNQKGFVTPVAILAVMIGIALISAGAIQSKKELSQKLQAAISSNLGANTSTASSSNKLTEAEVEAVKEEQKANSDMIIVSGKTPSSLGENTYKIYLPKKGGNVSGTIHGNCNGDITGTYDGKDLGRVSGKFVVNCPAGPGKVFKAQIKSDYEGKVNLTEGKISLYANTTEPFSLGTWFELPFTPISDDQNSKDNKNKLVNSGFYQFSEYKIPYEFIVPKNGGSVTGSIGGVCNGAPDGNFEGKEGGKIEGTLKAKCTMGPMNLVNVDIEIKYTGTVSIKDNKAFLNYEVVKPVSQKGYVPMSFNN